MGSFALKSLFLSLLSGCLVEAAPAAPATKDNLARDAKTLQHFAKSVTSDSQGIIANWTGTDVCSWKGVYCADSPGGYKAVASIDFNNFNLGKNLRLKGLLDKLVDLAIFHANSNDFTGTIPDLSQLPYFYELDLSNNHLTGLFPKGILSAELDFLDLRFNTLQGPLPNNLFTDRNTETIFLNDNKFSGTLPEASNLTATYLTLANNEFEGDIPTSYGTINGLKEILLLGNDKLTGTVPEELCALNLDVLDVTGTSVDKKLGPNCKALKKKGVLKI